MGVSGAMYVGVDVRERKCRAAVVDGDGVLVDEFSFSNDFEGIRRFVSRLSEGDAVVMESTGNLWVNLYEAVEAMGVKAVLANPLKMRAIASAKIKNDKVDARVLASLLRGGLVAECYVLPLKPTLAAGPLLVTWVISHPYVTFTPMAFAIS
jgi:transposase